MIANRLLRLAMIAVGMSSVLLDARAAPCPAQDGLPVVLPNPFDYLPDGNATVPKFNSGATAGTPIDEPPVTSIDKTPVKSVDQTIEPTAKTAPEAAPGASTEPTAEVTTESDAGSSEDVTETVDIAESEMESQLIDEPPVEEFREPTLQNEARELAGKNDVPPANDKRQRLRNKQYRQAYVIDLEGAIFGRFHWYLNQRLDRAQQMGADLVILRLTTPGGDLEKSLQIARRLRDIDWATTVVYIPEEAISGGAIISLGCDFIFMQKGALIGDAGPIRVGWDGQVNHAEEKLVSYLASAVRELAQSKDRPPGLAEAMVDRSVILHAAVEQATGKATVLTEVETQAAGAQQRFVIQHQLPESGQNRFLTVGAERAEELAISEGVFGSEDGMFDEFEIAAIERTQLTWIDNTIYILNRPWLTAILLIVGLVGLYLELVAPGISVAGLVATLCFGIFFWSHALGGTSGWLEVLLFVLGVGCLIVELFVLPGFGIFGLTGLGLVSVSLIMASQDFLLPSTSFEWNQLQTNALIVLGAVLGVLLLFVGQVVLLDSIPGLNRFRLSAPDTSLTEPMDRSFSLASGPLAENREPIAIGLLGQAESDLRPSGKVILSGRLVDVVTEGDFVDVGTTVEVVRVEGNRVVVRKTSPSRP